jgi:hypothetical protein
MAKLYILPHPFTGPQSSLRCSHDLVTGPNSEPQECNPSSLTMVLLLSQQRQYLLTSFLHIRRLASFFFSLFGWGDTETAWYLDQHLVYCTCTGWWLRVWRSRWDEWQGIPTYWETTCPSDALSTINPTWSDLGSNPDRRGGTPVIKLLSYGTAIFRLKLCIYLMSFINVA